MVLRRIASHLPPRWQRVLRRAHFARQIRRGAFRPNEPEVARLHAMLAPGDWVLDVGANVGHYAAIFSQLLGPAGRVIAMEPVPETFSILAENALLFAHPNVTLLNVAASDVAAVGHVEVPTWNDGTSNYYVAHLSENKAGLPTVCMPIDALDLPQRVALVKIDVEDHEIPVLQGMTRLLERDHPRLIVEANSPYIGEFLEPFGYRAERLPGSPNFLLEWTERAQEEKRGARPAEHVTLMPR